MNEDQCRQDESNTTRRTNRSKENEWALIYSNQVMKNSQIINVWTDEKDNNSKSLGKCHLSLTRKIHNEIGTKRGRCLKAHIGTLISNWLIKKQLSMSNIYTKWRITLYTYINTCAYYIFFLFFLPYSKYQQMNSIENT